MADRRGAPLAGDQALFVAGEAGVGAALLDRMRHGLVPFTHHVGGFYCAVLVRMQKLTDGFTPPAGTCNTWRALYAGLEALDADLREHIHLENNVLFPRALSGR
ncbi:MAG: hypothetical protein RIT45_3935 [Pseudomonadota bacterium]